MVFNFLYYTGLRLGELIALTWNDVNLQRKEIYIRNNFTNKIEGKFMLSLIQKQTIQSVQ